MDKKEFAEWYRENVEIMARLGVLHPDSPFGKTVHLAVASIQPQINTINERLERIEKLLDSDYVPDETKQKIKAPVKEIILEAVEVQEKVEEIKKREPKPKPAAKPRAKKSAWKIAKQ